MLDYVFFHQQPWERFLDFLRKEGLQPEVMIDEETRQASLPEDLADDVMDRIEAFYEEMIDLNQRLFDEEQGDSEQHVAGVVVTAEESKTVYAEIEPALLAKIMSVLTPEEFGKVVDAIVDAVQLPDERTLCQRARDAGDID
ncbi:MAG TPA: hypothetical protein EYP40_07370 [Chromatiales bacterium]|nr:hypothetical protein [Chromatiales bacterium]